MVGSCGTVWKHAETCGNVARPCTLQAAGLSLSDLGCKVCKVCSIGRLWLLYCAEDILTQSSCLAPEDPEAKNCGADSKRICPASAATVAQTRRNVLGQCTVGETLQNSGRKDRLLCQDLPYLDFVQ